jgi:hypothetical protein
MTARYKPGSRVQKVWEKFETDGPEAAVTFGLTLDLKPGTLREWMRMFAKLLGQPVPTVKIASKAAAPLPTYKAAPTGNLVPRKLAKGEAYVPAKNDRVRLAYDDDDTWGPGTIVAAGPQTSSWRADRDRMERNSSNGQFVQLVPKVQR